LDSSEKQITRERLMTIPLVCLGEKEYRQVMRPKTTNGEG
jgi:hypothetical protein